MRNTRSYDLNSFPSLRALVVEAHRRNSSSTS